MELSVVLPCFNEEAAIGPTISDVLAYFDSAGIDGEVIVTNDGSQDDSQKVLEAIVASEPRVKIVRHESNRGYGAALTSGLDIATKEYVGFMDGDGQFHAADVGKLLPLLTQVDVATGIRANRADPFIRRCNAKLYGFLVRWTLNVRARDINCAMKVWRRSLWPRIRPDAKGALFNAELFLRMRRQGIVYKQVPVGHYARTAGTPTGGNPFVILRMFQELFALRMSSKRMGAPRTDPVR